MRVIDNNNLNNQTSKYLLVIANSLLIILVTIIALKTNFADGIQHDETDLKLQLRSRRSRDQQIQLASKKKLNNSDYAYNLPAYQLVETLPKATASEDQRGTGIVDNRLNEIEISDDLVSTKSLFKLQSSKNSSTSSRPNWIKKKQFNEDIGNHRKSLKNSTKSNFEDETINLLLNMLMMANKKCADKSKAIHSQKSTTTANDNMDDYDQTAGRFLDSQSTSSSSISTTKLSPTSDESSSKSNKKSNLKTRTAKGKSSKQVKSTIDDHVLVRPGFEDVSSTTVSSIEAKYPPSKTKDLANEQDLSQNAAIRYPATSIQNLLIPNDLLLHNHHVQNPHQTNPYLLSHEELMKNHRPIVAHDILNNYYNRQQQQQQLPNQYQSSQPNKFTPTPLIENMFVSRQPASSLASFGSPDKSKQMHEHPSSKPTTQAPYSPDQHEHHPYLKRFLEGMDQTSKPFQPMVPPYNGWSLQQPSSTPTSLTSAGPLQAIREPANDHMNHMLNVARNQQAAALAYEKRRLEHEMELQKQSEQIKKHHEEQVEKQRQAAMREQEEKQRANSNGSNDGQGDDKSVHDNNQQPEQQQQQNESGDHQQEDGPQQNSLEEGPEQGNKQTNDADDPEMKGFHDFAGNTDFTDLFPPGILSQEEIREMHKQQEEQQRKEQEEQQGPDSEEENETGNGEQQAEQQPAEQQSDAQQQQQHQQRAESARSAASSPSKTDGSTAKLNETTKSMMTMMKKLPDFVANGFSKSNNSLNSTKRRRSSATMVSPRAGLDARPFVGAASGRREQYQRRHQPSEDLENDGLLYNSWDDTMRPQHEQQAITMRQTVSISQENGDGESPVNRRVSVQSDADDDTVVPTTGLWRYGRSNSDGDNP